MAKENEIVLFETEDAKVRLTVPIQEDTVWLTQAQMTELFDTSKQNVSLHINNCFKEGELDKVSVVKDFLTTASDGKKYKTKYYNLDVIISVGYRVKSQRGIEFRRWANKVLRDYIIKGYAINDKRLEALQKTVEIQAKLRAYSSQAEYNGFCNGISDPTTAWSINRDWAAILQKAKETFMTIPQAYEQGLQCQNIIDSLESWSSARLLK